MSSPRREKEWVLRATDEGAAEAIAALAAETGHSPVVARLLYLRGCRSAADVRRFLYCEEASLHSPFLLRDIEKAVARVRRAVADGEKIVIYGDYDVDGVTSVSMLYLYLTSLGADVGYYIPSRSREGYGLCSEVIDRLAARGVTCIITVDTGITAVEETAHARSLGIDMVITDHHECRLPLPEAVAVVNPHRPDCPYPFKELAGVGVVFKLIAAIEATVGMEAGEDEIEGVRRVSAAFADLVAIGTIADVMPITDENRLIVKQGLSLLRKNPRLGLEALIEEASAGNRTAGAATPPKKKKITSSFIGFGLAPRINAAGRMSEASHAVELLLCETREEAARLAAELCEINRQRQVEENRIAEQAYRRIEEEFDLAETRVLVLEDDSWQQGIIGIVSSRVTERYGCPSILISFDGTKGFDSPDDEGKGSGRSIKGMNLVEALTACEDLLVKFGGHELAAGLTIRRDRIDEFRARINEYASHCFTKKVTVQLDADAEITLDEATLELAEELLLLEPFGVSNPVPQFILRDVTVGRITELGGGKHLKLLLTDGTHHVPALCFSTSRAEFSFCEGDHIDLLCTLDVNEFRDVRSAQLVVQDVKASASFEAMLAAERQRYAVLRAGGTFAAEEDFIPCRDDFAHVYTVLRREFRMGCDTFDERSLLLLVNLGRETRINYVKLKYMIEILRELKICGVEEPEEGFYRFDIYFNVQKTSFDKSSILKHLKSRCKE